MKTLLLSCGTLVLLTLPSSAEDVLCHRHGVPQGMYYLGADPFDFVTMVFMDKGHGKYLVSGVGVNGHIPEHECQTASDGTVICTYVAVMPTDVEGPTPQLPKVYELQEATILECEYTPFDDETLVFAAGEKPSHVSSCQYSSGSLLSDGRSVVYGFEEWQSQYSCNIPFHKWD